MKIIINSAEYEIQGGTAQDAVNLAKPDADVIIKNGHLTDGSAPLADGDIIHLIKKGEIPTDAEMRSLMTARHTPKVADRLAQCRMAVCGLGGLGSNIALNLARMGVGSLLLIDFDVVEPSNLNRQQYYADQTGMKKTDATLINLRRVNPYLDYDVRDMYITADDVAGLFDGCDVVIEAFDRAENKAMLINSISQIYKDTHIIGASGVAGLGCFTQFRVVRAGRNVHIVGDFVSEAKEGRGLMATRVAVAAGIQANLAVRLVLGDSAD